MSEFFRKSTYWIYIKILFAYKYILHKKRTKTMIPVSFSYRLKQFIEYMGILAAIGLMIYFANKLSPGK